MDFTNIADGAVPDPFAGLADAFTGVSLIAELGGDAHFPGDLHDEARFPDVVRERFLAIGMFALAHGGDTDVGVGVIGGRAQDRVNRFLLLEHDAEILVFGDFEVRGLGAVMFLDLGLDRFAAAHPAVVEILEAERFLRIGHRHDLDIIELKQRASIGAALAATADEGDIHLGAGSDGAGGAEDLARENADGGDGGGGGGEKTATGQGAVAGWRHKRHMS